MSGSNLLRATKRQSKVFAAAQKQRGDEQICRLCHGEENFSDLISPCDCSGSIKWAHSTCLDEFLKNDNYDTYCSVCRRMYNYVPTDPVVAVFHSFSDWVIAFGTFIGFPYAFSSGDWILMALWGILPGFKLAFDIVLVHWKQLRIGPKTVFGQEALSIAVMVMAVINIGTLFVQHCLLFKWSVDFQRLWPSTVSLIVCETISFSIGSAFVALFGHPEDYDGDDIIAYSLLLGLGFWAVIRAEAMSDPQMADGILTSSTGQCPVRPFGGAFTTKA